MAKFTNTTNDKLFSQWEEIKRSNGMSSPSVNQYRNGAYTLEDMLCGESFDNLTIEALTNSIEANQTKKNHINSLVCELVGYGLCNIKPSVVVEAMGTREQMVVRRLLNL